jgi:hypothetical protein
VDVGDHILPEGGVGGCDLPRDPSLPGLEDGTVPPVVVGPHVEPVDEPEAFEIQLLQMRRSPSLDLFTPAFVLQALAEEPGSDVRAVVDLPVEVVDLFSGDPDLGVVHDVAVQPGRASLLRSYADEIRVH